MPQASSDGQEMRLEDEWAVASSGDLLHGLGSLLSVQYPDFLFTNLEKERGGYRENINVCVVDGGWY